MRSPESPGSNLVSICIKIVQHVAINIGHVFASADLEVGEGVQPQFAQQALFQSRSLLEMPISLLPIGLFKLINIVDQTFQEQSLRPYFWHEDFSLEAHDSQFA